ncbi:MAG: copper resistance protein CopC [Chloroflexota bacterium]
MPNTPLIRALAALVLAALCLLPPTTSNAHGYIVRSIPEDRAVLERPPTRVQYWFSEDLEPEFSEITLLDANGDEIVQGQVDPDNNALMLLRPPTDLPDGAYVVSLRPAFASDGHVVAETRVFFVGEAVAGVSGSAASDEAVRLEVVWRGMVLSATTLLLGVTTLYTLVLRPAWGSRRFVRGLLPPRVMTHLTWIAGGALAVAVIGNILAILQNASVLFNQDLATIIANGSWNTARIGSRFGEVWTVRSVLLVLFGVLLGLTIYWRDDKPRTVAPTWGAMTWLAAFITATFAVSSHASGSLVMPWVAILMHWLHTTAVAAWTGGLVALVLVLPVALRPYEGEQRRTALLAALRRFSRVAIGAALLTVTTGVYNALNWLYAPAELTGTAYGLALVYKVVLVGGVLVVAATQQVIADPDRYAALARLTGRLRPNITLPVEAAVAFAVLIAAGVVSATPPPTPDFIEDGVPAPRAAITVNGVSVAMTVTPGGPGVNTYDTRVLDADESALSDAAVFVRFVQPSADVRGVWHSPDEVEPGLFVSAGDEIDTAGDWVALVDVVRVDGDTTRAAFDFTVTDAASVQQSITPHAQHWIALAAVIAALAWTAAPAYRAFMERMNFNAATGTVVLVAIVATVVGTLIGFQFIGGLQSQNAALINPPPQVVNPTLPDAASLARGEIAFADGCDWTDDDTFEQLVTRLPRTRDDELYAAVTEGWRGLDACEAGAEEAWDIVNHLRTLEAR